MNGIIRSKLYVWLRGSTMKMMWIMGLWVYGLIHGMEERKSVFVDMPPIEDKTCVIQRVDACSNLARPRSQEIHIHIDKPETPETSEGTEDTIPKRHHNRRMIISNSVSALLATAITASVTLAIHFSSCKKD